MKAYDRTAKTFAAALFAAALALLVPHARAAAERGARESAHASTIVQYRSRVRGAAEALEGLAAFFEKSGRDDEPEWRDTEHGGAREFEARQRAALERARTLLPPKERVEWAGGRVEVDNSWLHTALDEYAQSDDDEKRAASLRLISERLRALEARLAEPEGEAAAAQDKDAERGRLNSILRGEEFNAAPQGNALQNLFEGIRDWFRSRMPSFGGGPAPNPRLSMLAQVIVIALCVLVLAYVARRVWSGRARELKSLRLRRRPRVILGERLEADATPADLLAAAEALARAGDLRGAIRKAYVALLCGLGDAGVVRLAQHKTNRDYLDAVRRSAPRRFYAEMLPLTLGFEQHWYGLRDATDEDWHDYNARCRRALKESGV
jgi:hypothetical protein